MQLTLTKDLLLA